MWHLAEPCPPWLKEAWIDWLGPERICELYAGTEAQAATIITGVEWLEHRGSVGRPTSGEFKVIRRSTATTLPRRRAGRGLAAPDRGRRRPTATSGAEARRLEGGWESLGDIGWLDDDGYLYLGDRLQDMILSGGANIYPAEVEAAIQEHPAVRSVCVIGLPDEDKGNRVHAIVEADPRRDRHRRSCSRSSPSAWRSTSCPAPSSSSTRRCATTRARCAARPCGPSASQVDRSSQLVARSSAFRSVNAGSHSR